MNCHNYEMSDDCTGLNFMYDVNSTIECHCSYIKENNKTRKDIDESRNRVC